MPGKARVEFVGAIYHLLNRGDRQEEIFRDALDREHFLLPLGQACARTGWRVHAYQEGTWAEMVALLYSRANHDEE